MQKALMHRTDIYDTGERMFKQFVLRNSQKCGQLWRASSRLHEEYKSPHVQKMLYRSLNRREALQETRHIEISTHHHRHEGNLTLIS
jgi:hypothetical protein